MASKDKPYRLYRGGRARGPIRLPPTPDPRSRYGDGHAGRYRRSTAPPRRRGRRIARIVLVLVLLAVAVAVAWVTLGFLAFRSGVGEANDRLDPRAQRALSPRSGSLLSNPANILLIGSDRGPGRGRDGRGRSDAIVLVRTDPDAHRLALLSIPRDLRVEIPGSGPEKINAAFSVGGPALAIDVVESLTGLEVNHVALVEFGSFGQVIDALGGVTVDVPRAVVSNRFDCPFSTPAECRRWPGWRFAPGTQEMNGQRALVYARVRENRLDPSESDITRGGRQQQVVQAIADEAVSVRTFLRLPFVGDDLLAPVATDLTAGEFLQLAWVQYRAASDQTLRCRLGGEISADGAFIIGSEENRSVIAMITGQTAPQPPLPGSGPFGPGCLAGRS